MNSFQGNGLSTPKCAAPPGIATSTVDRKKVQKQIDAELSVDSSLGILSLNNVDLSNIAEVSRPSSVEEVVLKQQLQLANATLDRISQMGAIPSKLLRADLGLTKSDTNFNLPYESTVNESDLMQTPKNTSTPRNSSCENGDLIPRVSIFSKMKDMLDSNVSMHNAVEEFKQIAQANKTEDSSSSLFIPGENAHSRLLADEISWRRKNEIQAQQSLTSFCHSRDLPSMSIGEFFQQKCDNIEDLRATSPSKCEPIALIDITSASNVARESVPVKENEKTALSGKSLSISTIQQLIAEKSTTNVMEYFLKQNRNSDRELMKPQRDSSEIFSLPVSRNASYTTSFSDNEAVRVAVTEDKENQRPLARGPTAQEPQVLGLQSPLQDDKASVPPSRSSSALTSLPNGKLPIESTVSDLVWGCIKVDRCVTKQFMLRNKSEKTLRLQCSLSSYEFKIRKDNRSDSDILSACKFVLHGHESRVLIVSFIPTKIGAAVDELVFSPLDGSLKQTKKQCIRLWGYGGYTSIEYQNVSRDNTGKYWLSLGRMDNRVLIEQQFAMKNTGSLPSFAYIKVVNKHMATFTNLRVEPSLFVLLPNEEKSVKVTYILTSKDCRLLKQNLNILPVADIGKLEIVTGTEVSRARLRRLNRKSAEKGLPVDDLTKVLSARVAGEVFPGDLARFKENPSAIPDLLETLNKDEMAITIEQDPNQTLVPECPEDSVVYQSLCEEATIRLNDTVLHNSCRLEPPSIVLFPPNKLEDSLFLISESPKKLHFEVVTSPTRGLYVSPTIGEICPGETAEFKIKLPRSPSEPHFKIAVYVENDVFEAEVKVMNVRSQQNRFLD